MPDASTPGASDVSTALPADAAVVAGLDVLTKRLTDADVLAERVANELSRQGAAAVFVASHPADSDGRAHVALSVSAVGVSTPSGWWEALTRAIASTAGPEFGFGFGDRFVGSPRLRGPVAAAANAQTSRTSGRVIVFPGRAALSGTMTVRRLIAESAIDHVRELAAGPAHPDALVRTRDFVRPRWAAGHLVLDTQPSAGGTLVPFETPFATACCSHHR